MQSRILPYWWKGKRESKRMCGSEEELGQLLVNLYKCQIYPMLKISHVLATSHAQNMSARCGCFRLFCQLWKCTMCFDLSILFTSSSWNMYDYQQKDWEGKKDRSLGSTRQSILRVQYPPTSGTNEHYAVSFPVVWRTLHVIHLSAAGAWHDKGWYELLGPGWTS